MRRHGLIKLSVRDKASIIFIVQGLTRNNVSNSSPCTLWILCLLHQWTSSQTEACSSTTTTIKHWKLPFCAENYKKHHNSQHPLQWKQYQTLDHEEKMAYFTNKLQFKDTLHSHFGSKNTPLLFNFNALIINTIIVLSFWWSWWPQSC